MVRAQRSVSLHPDRSVAECVAAALAEYRPLSHRKILEYMDLVAVKECTDQLFLPPAYATLTADGLDARLAELKRELGFT